MRVRYTGMLEALVAQKIAQLRAQVRAAELNLATARYLDPHAADAAKEHLYQLRDRLQVAIFAEELRNDLPLSP